MSEYLEGFAAGQAAAEAGLTEDQVFPCLHPGWDWCSGYTTGYGETMERIREREKENNDE